MNKYLIEFILDTALGLIFTIFIPIIMYIVAKDMHIRKQIDRGAVPYLHTTNSVTTKKIIFMYLGQALMAILIIVNLVFFQIPALRDIPSLITGNLLSSEGVIAEVENHKKYITIHVNNIEINEGTWFRTTIEPYSRYKISYLKHSKYIIKAERID